MLDVQYMVMVKPQADLGYPSITGTMLNYDLWVTYGIYRSLPEAIRVIEEIVKKVDSDSILLCKKVDKRMVLELG